MPVVRFAGAAKIAAGTIPCKDESDDGKGGDGHGVGRGKSERFGDQRKKKCGGEGDGSPDNETGQERKQTEFQKRRVFVFRERLHDFPDLELNTAERYAVSDYVSLLGGPVCRVSFGGRFYPFLDRSYKIVILHWAVCGAIFLSPDIFFFLDTPQHRELLLQFRNTGSLVCDLRIFHAQHFVQTLDRLLVVFEFHGILLF